MIGSIPSRPRDSEEIFLVEDEREILEEVERALELINPGVYSFAGQEHPNSKGL